MSLPSIEELIENFSYFDDKLDRYGYLIDLGRQLPPMNDALKVDLNFVKGCTSKVWMVGHFNDADQLELIADSNADIVRGLIAIVISAYNGKTREEIAAINIKDIFTQLGLESNLVVNRRNGFYAMVGRVEALAQS